MENLKNSKKLRILNKRFFPDVPSSVCYIPMFGYLLVVPKNTTFPPSVQNEVELLYETDDAIHVKNERMRQLDREIGDIKMEIIDIETNAMLRFIFTFLIFEPGNF